jgi:hypothetical protein
VQIAYLSKQRRLCAETVKMPYPTNLRELIENALKRCMVFSVDLENFMNSLVRDNFYITIHVRFFFLTKSKKSFHICLVLFCNAMYNVLIFIHPGLLFNVVVAVVIFHNLAVTKCP